MDLKLILLELFTNENTAGRDGVSVKIPNAIGKPKKLTCKGYMILAACLDAASREA